MGKGEQASRHAFGFWVYLGILLG